MWSVASLVSSAQRLGRECPSFLAPQASNPVVHVKNWTGPPSHTFLVLLCCRLDMPCLSIFGWSHGATRAGATERPGRAANYGYCPAVKRGCSQCLFSRGRHVQLPFHLPRCQSSLCLSLPR